MGETGTIGGDITIDLVSPTTILGDATINFEYAGDFGADIENMEVTLDEFDLGTVSNGNTGDDPFTWSAGPGGTTTTGYANDYGDDEWKTSTIGSATILNADFAPLIADGTLQLVAYLSDDLQSAQLGVVAKIKGTIEFTTAPAAVPEPSTLAIFALGGIGILAKRLPRKRAHRASQTTS